MGSLQETQSLLYEMAATTQFMETEIDVVGESEVETSMETSGEEGKADPYLAWLNDPTAMGPPNAEFVYTIWTGGQEFNFTKVPPTHSFPKTVRMG